jgi:hypothetical protein
MSVTTTSIIVASSTASASLTVATAVTSTP